MAKQSSNNFAAPQNVSKGIFEQIGEMSINISPQNTEIPTQDN